MSEEEEYKITVSLSRKGMTALDSLKETSGFGSRGRTIEEAILTVSEITEMGRQFFPQYTLDMQNQGKVSETTQTAIVGWFAVIVIKLSRFMPSWK